MIIEYDKSPNASLERRIQSLADSVMRALDELKTSEEESRSQEIEESKKRVTPIKYGGTDADNANDALTNLGAFPKAGGTIEGDLSVQGTASLTNPLAISSGGTDATSQEQALINLLGYTPSYIQVRATETEDDYSTSKNYFMPFFSGTAPTVYSETKGNLTLETDSVTFGDREDQTVYGIRIGANINMVRINTMVYFFNNTATGSTVMAPIYRWRNGESTAYTLATTTVKYGEVTYASCCPTAIVDVEEGDFIFVGAYKGVASCEVGIGYANGRTTMIVEAIG